MYRDINRDKIKFIWREGMPTGLHYHEAGHAVVSFHFGYLATRGKIMGMTNGVGHSLRVRHHRNLRQRRSATARIILAGEIASFEACKKGLARDVTPLSIPDIEELDQLGVVVPGMDYSDNIIDKWGSPCAEKCSIFRKTITLVRRRWTQITSVATRFAERGELEFDEFCECVLNSSPDFQADSRMCNWLVEASSTPEDPLTLEVTPGRDCTTRVKMLTRNRLI